MTINPEEKDLLKHRTVAKKNKKSCSSVRLSRYKFTKRKKGQKRLKTVPP